MLLVVTLRCTTFRRAVMRAASLRYAIPQTLALLSLSGNSAFAPCWRFGCGGRYGRTDAGQSGKPLQSWRGRIFGQSFLRRVAQFKRAIEIKPDFVSAACRACSILFDLNRLAEALTIGRAAVRASPASAMAQALAGTVMLSFDLPDEASAHFEAAIRFAPSNAVYHHSQAFALQCLGQYDCAVRHYRMASRLLFQVGCNGLRRR